MGGRERSRKWGKEGRKERRKEGGREGKREGRMEEWAFPQESFENFLRHQTKYFENVDNTTLYIVTYYTVLVCCLNHKLHANGLIHKPLTFFMSS